jgi:predicted nucleic acid-binding protein
VESGWVEDVRITSGLVAAANAKEPDHRVCLDVILANRGRLVLSPFAMAEVDYLIQNTLGVRAEITFLRDVDAGRYTLATFDERDMSQALAVVEQYEDLGIGVADASVAVLAARYRTTRLLTLDEQHFRAMRPLGGGTFTLLPADQ